MLRTFRIRLDLLPELPDIYTKVLRVREVIPQLPQQKSVRQHLAGMLNKHAQELVFLGSGLLALSWSGDAEPVVDDAVPCFM